MESAGEFIPQCAEALTEKIEAGLPPLAGAGHMMIAE